jgi:hypothetical protein
MEQSLTIPTDQFSPRTTWVKGQGNVPLPGLCWAPLFNALQDVLGRPTAFRTRDFLIVFEFEHDVLAVFCTQGRRRGEVVISADSRNPHIQSLEKVEQAVDQLRETIRAEAIALGLEESEYDEEDTYDDEEW